MTITFYSYKGGVGRSLALINVAEILADAGYRVIICDFDLEAPGLERYACDSRAAAKELEKQEGIIDLLTDYKASLSSTADTIDAMPRLRSPLEAVREVPRPRGWLALLTAGKRDSSERPYARLVQEFDWADFYERWAGGSYLEYFRKSLDRFADLESSPDRGDIVLIDSRTGVTEHGGVCTHHLADGVVVLSAANDLNIDGTSWITEKLTRPELAKLRNGRPLWILPIASRIEQRAEKDQLVKFRTRFATEFTGFVPLAAGPADFTERTEIPYVPFYSFEERVVAREPKELRLRELYDAYLSIAQAIVRLGMEASLLQSPREADWLPPSEQEEGAARSVPSLSRILLAHENWIGSDGERGERAVLAGRDLTNSDLSGRVLRKADLRGTKLARANLERCNLTDADLTEAVLDRASLVSANLTRARLARGSLVSADLTSANLTESDLTDANLEGTLLHNVDLQSAIGLTPRQLRYSTTDSTTSLPFGISDDLAPSPQRHPARFLAYVSYHHADKPIAISLARALEQVARPWYSRRKRIFFDEIHFGSDLASSSLARVLDCEYLILVLSPGAVDSSWMTRELRVWLEQRSIDRVVVANLGVETLVPEYAELMRRDINVIDLTWLHSQDQLTTAYPRFQEAVARIGAIILGVQEVDLIRLEVQNRRRVRQLLVFAIALSGILSCLSALAINEARLSKALARTSVARMAAERQQAEQLAAKVQALDEVISRGRVITSPVVARANEPGVCLKYGLCGYDQNAWRKTFLHDASPGTWWVIVRSLPEGAAVAAEKEAGLLRDQFPNLDFGVENLAHVDGSNTRLAIIIASGVKDAATATRIVSFARDLGVDKQAYKMVMVR